MRERESHSRRGRSLFRDPDVMAARAAGGRVTVGAWRLHLPRVFGFCGGVLNAVRLVEECLDRPGRTGRVWLLGEIIHNRTVNEHFRAAGARLLAEPDVRRIIEIASPDDTVVIPAFGVPADLDRRIRQAFPPERIVDTTCRYVQRIWDFVAERAAEGWTIAIHGKPEHAETQATSSRALTPGNALVVVPNPETADRLAAAWRRQDPAGYPPELLRQPDRIAFDRLAMVNQTTMLHTETFLVRDRLADAVRRLGGRFEICDTVCHATQERQDSARALCEQDCDLALVIGDHSSSNTRELHRLASTFGPAYLIAGAAALDADRIRHYSPTAGHEIETSDWLPREADIALFAGASCPACDIGDVLRRFAQIQRP